MADHGLCEMKMFSSRAREKCTKYETCAKLHRFHILCNKWKYSFKVGSSLLTFSETANITCCCNIKIPVKLMILCRRGLTESRQMNCNCIGFFYFYTMSLEQNNLNLVITAIRGCYNKRTFYKNIRWTFLCS